METYSGESALRGIVRAYGLVEKALTPALACEGISTFHWGVLRALEQYEKSGRSSASLSQLRNELLVEPPSLTAVLNSLQKRGLLKQSVRIDDLRVGHVSLTEAGKNLIARVERDRPRRIAMALGRLNYLERRDLALLLDKLTSNLDADSSARAISGPEDEGDCLVGNG